MAFERIITKLAGAQPATDSDSDAPRMPDIRGSGSWANEWNGAERMVERAKSMAAPARTRREIVTLDGEHGVVETRPLMNAKALKLHERLCDKLEIEAPTCSVHAGVAMASFLKAERRADGSDRLEDLTVDLLIVDGKGEALATLIYPDRLRPQRQIRRVDVLVDAGLPVIEIPPRGGVPAIWAELSAHLPDV